MVESEYLHNKVCVFAVNESTVNESTVVLEIESHEHCLKPSVPVCYMEYLCVLLLKAF